MTFSTQMLVIFIMLMTLLSTTTAKSMSERPEIKGKFSTSKGDVIELDTKTGTLVTPRSRGTALRDCSDKFQVCLTDNHGFAFAYFQKCNDAGFGDYTRLKFRPKIVSVLHGNLWMVFDAAPNYLFHYTDSKGIVGIYLGRTASFDFRSVLRDPNFRVFDLDSMEYRVVSSDTIAACSE